MKRFGSLSGDDIRNIISRNKVGQGYVEQSGRPYSLTALSRQRVSIGFSRLRAAVARSRSDVDRRSRHSSRSCCDICCRFRASSIALRRDFNQTAGGVGPPITKSKTPSPQLTVGFSNRTRGAVESVRVAQITRSGGGSKSLWKVITENNLPSASSRWTASTEHMERTTLRPARSITGIRWQMSSPTWRMVAAAISSFLREFQSRQY